jgi:biopolymer transport protein ExbD
MPDKKMLELPEVAIDMTPMIDVVFNLLIFFMLVNNMVQEERTELTLPIAEQIRAEDTNQVVDKKQLVINIKKNGVVEIAGRPVEWGELTRILFEESRISKDKETGLSGRSVLIRGDIEAQYKIVQKVMVECAKQKLFKLGFSAKPSNED